MVKLFFTLLFCGHTVHAGFYLGLLSNSWQDAVPVTYRDSTSGNQVTTYALTTFSTISAGGGYEGQFAMRWRYSADLYGHTGTADIHKLVGTVSPRKNATSMWFSTKINYRQSKTFNYGPQLVVNAVQLSDVGTATSMGLLVNLEFEMYEGLRLIQALGSMNDSGTIAYSIGLQKYF